MCQTALPTYALITDAALVPQQPPAIVVQHFT